MMDNCLRRFPPDYKLGHCSCCMMCVDNGDVHCAVCFYTNQIFLLDYKLFSIDTNTKYLHVTENIFVTRVESALAQLTSELTQRYSGVGVDIEARCRGYVEFAGTDCFQKVTSLAQELQALGRRILSEKTEECTEETTVFTTQVAEEEEERLSRQGRSEEDKLKTFYEGRGKEIETEVIKEFEDRGKDIETRVRRDAEERGKEEEQKIRREFELRGEVERKSVELELRKRGEVEGVAIREEFEERGRNLEAEIRKEFEERGEQIRAEVERELREKGVRLRDEGEEQCTEMITMACEEVVPGSESDEFCEEFFFFTGDLSDEEKKRLRRKINFRRQKRRH